MPFFFLLGHTTPVPPPSTDLSSVPSPPGPTLPSYQDSKPASAWNDPPNVVRKVSKPNPTKVNSILMVLLLHHSLM